MRVLFPFPRIFSRCNQTVVALFRHRNGLIDGFEFKQCDDIIHHGLCSKRAAYENQLKIPNMQDWKKPCRTQGWKENVRERRRPVYEYRIIKWEFSNNVTRHLRLLSWWHRRAWCAMGG